MDTKEKWLDSYNNIIYNNDFVRLSHYYGKGRAYCAVYTVRGYTTLNNAIKEAKKAIKEGKKYITPEHGMTNYIN